jgi:UDP-galactopyranose mutase
VIVLEEPVHAAENGADVETIGSVTVVTPRRSAHAEVADDDALETVRELVGKRRPLVWLYTPMMLALADAFPDAPLVYDKMDELAAFAFADPRLREREDALLARADQVFTGGISLQRTVLARAPRARCFPSGVDAAHFASAAGAAAHPALATYAERPIFMYVGVIDERIDLELLAALADHRPDAAVVLVGPVVKIDERTLPQRANIVYLGMRGYDELPALLAAADVALMPFARNEHTANISPTKTLEYLAAGCRVVSTAIPDVVAEYTGVVDIAADIPDFLRLVDRSALPDAKREQRAQAKIAAGSWDGIAAAMRQALEGAV